MRILIVIMKKLVVLLFALQSIGLQAQYEAGIRIGIAYTAIPDFVSPATAKLFIQGNFGYRFFHQKRLSVVASAVIEQSSYTMKDLTFGSYILSNGSFVDITYHIAAAGIRVAPEIKLLNPEKSTNVYLMPAVGFRRVFSFTQIASEPEADITRHPSFNQGILIDGGLEIGAKFRAFKAGFFYRTIINRNAQNTTVFILTGCAGIGFSYFFNRKTTEE